MKLISLGKPRKGKKDDDDIPKLSFGTNKTPVFGVVERKSDKVQAQVVMLPNSKAQKTHSYLTVNTHRKTYY